MNGKATVSEYSDERARSGVSGSGVRIVDIDMITAFVNHFLQRGLVVSNTAIDFFLSSFALLSIKM